MVISTLVFITPIATLLAVILTSTFYLIILKNTSVIIKRNSNLIPVYVSSIVMTIQESLGSLRDIVLDANQEFATDGFREKDLKLRRKLSNNEFLGESPKYLLETSIFISLILYGLISSKLYINNITTLGAFALGAQKLLPSVQNIYKSFTMMKAYKYDFSTNQIIK